MRRYNPVGVTQAAVLTVGQTDGQTVGQAAADGAAVAAELAAAIVGNLRRGALGARPPRWGRGGAEEVQAVPLYLYSIAYPDVCCYRGRRCKLDPGLKAPVS